MSENFEFIMDTNDKSRFYYDKKGNKFLKINNGIITEINEGNQEYNALQYIRKCNNKSSKKYAAALMLLLYALILGGETSYFAENYSYIDFELDEIGTDVLLTKMLDNNKNLSEENKEEISRCVNMYVSRCEELGVDYSDNFVTILHNIKRLEKTSEYVITENGIKENYLNQIFTFSNGKFIVDSMLNSNESDNYISNYLYFHDNAMRTVLAGRNVNLVINGKEYSFNVDEIDSINFEVEKYIRKDVKEHGANLNLDKIRTNIFSDTLVCDDYPYTRFYERNRKKDGINLVETTSSHYYFLLAEKIYNLPDEIDYNDEDNRAIVYLYANALLVNMGYQKNLETVKFIIDSTGEDKRVVAFTRSNLYKYLNGEKLNAMFLECLGQIGLYDGGLGLLTTVDKCLKIDVSVGNITEDEYNEFLDSAITYLKIRGGEDVEKFMNYHIHNKVTEGYKLEIIHERKA